MIYDDAIETTVSQAQAQREVRLHGLEWEDFTAEVLGWLGY